VTSIRHQAERHVKERDPTLCRQTDCIEEYAMQQAGRL